MSSWLAILNTKFSTLLSQVFLEKDSGIISSKLFYGLIKIRNIIHAKIFGLNIKTLALKQFYHSDFSSGESVFYQSV